MGTTAECFGRERVSQLSRRHSSEGAAVKFNSRLAVTYKYWCHSLDWLFLW